MWATISGTQKCPGAHLFVRLLSHKDKKVKVSFQSVTFDVRLNWPTNWESLWETKSILSARKTSQCTFACDNCHSCSVLQHKYLMRPFPHICFSLRSQTGAVPECVSSLESGGRRAARLEGASACLVLGVTVWTVLVRISRENKNSCSHSSMESVPSTSVRAHNRLALFVLLCSHGHFPCAFQHQ